MNGHGGRFLSRTSVLRPEIRQTEYHCLEGVRHYKNIDINFTLKLYIGTEKRNQLKF